MKNKGFSLIEVLVAIVMFTILAVIATQTTVFSLRGSRRSDASTVVRENMDSALNVLERHLRNATSITSTCGQTLSSITYENEVGKDGSFSCLSDENGLFLASASATQRLTNKSIRLTTCSFTCTTPTKPQETSSVTVNLVGERVTSDTNELSPVSVSTTIFLRTY